MNQLNNIIENIAFHGIAFVGAMVTIVAIFYYPESVERRGKLMVLLSICLVMVPILGVAVVVHPFFFVLYLVILYPVYALYKGDSAARIIVGIYLLLAAVSWSVIFIIFQYVKSFGDIDYGTWVIQVTALLMVVSNFTSSLLMLFGESVRSYQYSKRRNE